MLIKHYTLVIRAVHSEIPLRINLFMLFLKCIHVSNFIHVFLFMFHCFYSCLLIYPCFFKCFEQSKHGSEM